MGKLKIEDEHYSLGEGELSTGEKLSFPSTNLFIIHFLFTLLLRRHKDAFKTPHRLRYYVLYAHVLFLCVLFWFVLTLLNIINLAFYYCFVGISYDYIFY